MWSELRGHTAGARCVVSERGEDLWVSSFKAGQHGESDRVQEGQCSEVCGSEHSRQLREESQRKRFFDMEVKRTQLKRILFPIYGASFFSTQFLHLLGSKQMLKVI